MHIHIHAHLKPRPKEFPCDVVDGSVDRDIAPALAFSGWPWKFCLLTIQEISPESLPFHPDSLGLGTSTSQSHDMLRGLAICDNVFLTRL